MPKSDVKIETDPKASKPAISSVHADDESVLQRLVTQVQAAQEQLAPGYRLCPITFEKDDDENFHMDMIAGLANMRARNYGVQEVDKLKAKLIAGARRAVGLHCAALWGCIVL